MLRPLIQTEHFKEADKFSIGSIRLELIQITCGNVNTAQSIKYFFFK